MLTVARVRSKMPIPGDDHRNDDGLDFEAKFVADPEADDADEGIPAIAAKVGPGEDE